MSTLLAALLALASAASPDGGALVGPWDGGVVVIPPNTQVTLKVAGLERWASSSESVDVRVSPGGLTLRSTGPAGTRLDVWLDGGAHLGSEVFVQSNDLTGFGVGYLPVTHSPLASVKRMADDAVVVRGPVGSVEDAVALEVVAEASPRLILLAALPAARVASAIESLNAGLPDGVHALWAGDRVVLRGHVPPEVLRIAQERAETELGLLARAVKGGRVWIGDEAHALPVIRLGPGLERLIVAAGVTHTAVAMPDVADVKVIDPEHVLVVGSSEGETMIELQRERPPPLRYRVQVIRQWDGADMICRLCAVLPRYGAGPHFSFIGDKVMIRGPIDTIEQAAEVEEALGVYPNLMLLDHPADERLAEQAALVNRRLKELGVLSVHVVRTGAKLWVEGTPSDASDLEVAHGLAEALFDPFVRLMPESRPIPFH